MPTLGLVKPDHDVLDLARLERYAPHLEILECDLRDADRLRSLILEFQPTEIYNFGGISSIVESNKYPELTHEINVGSVQAILSAMGELGRHGLPARLVTAASGTIFEGVDRSPQNEDTDPSPQSPYAKSKSLVIDMCNQARQSQGLFAVSAILYNHESPLRGEGFVTRKISMAVAQISAGLQNRLELGNIDVARDWGWAPDYVRAMQLMIRADEPSNYVLATGISHRLSFFVGRAFAAAGIANWSDYVVSTEAHQRTIDTNLLVGDSTRAYRELGWRHSVDFDGMATQMVQFDIQLLQNPDLLWTDLL